MKSKMLVWLLGLLLLGFFACASAPKWRIRDAQGQVLTLQDVRFEPAERMVVQAGTARREVLASQLQWLQVDPSQMKVEDGVVFYGAKMRFLDGSCLPDSTLGDSVGGIFIPVDAELVSTSRGNNVRVRVAQIREFGTFAYFGSRDSVRHAELVPKTDTTVHADSTAKPAVMGASSSVLGSSAAAIPAKP